MLEKLAKHHRLWGKMASDLGVQRDKIDDFVQDLYIRLYELEQQGKDFSFGDDVNKFYVFLTMRSMFGEINRNNKRTGVSFTSIDEVVKDSDDIFYSDSLIYDGSGVKQKEQFEIVYEKVLDCLTNLPSHPDYPEYLKKKVPMFMNLFIGYHFTGKSMRTISDETGIRLGTIHQTLNKVMDIVRAEVGEDVASYFNKDYNYE